MSELYLIAHKVRGEPAFDVAGWMRCPNCNGVGGPGIVDFETGKDPGYEGYSCVECDGLGFWWIIPTSGHRAYPYWSCSFEHIMCDGNLPNDPRMPLMPLSLPDHYPTRASPSRESALLAMLPKPPSRPIPRKF